MGSTIFFVVVGFFCFGGCTRLEDSAPGDFSVVLSWLGGFFCFSGCTGLDDCALVVFSVVLLWLGGFFCCGFVVFYVLWWLCGFFCGALVFFLLLMVLALPQLVFLLFGGDLGLMSLSRLELTPPELKMVLV
jgi:hypothetical protein